MVGSLIYGLGALLCGYISDNYGRKATILVCTALNIAFHLVSTFANSYPLYLALYLLAGSIEGIKREKRTITNVENTRQAFSSMASTSGPLCSPLNS